MTKERKNTRAAINARAGIIRDAYLAARDLCDSHGGGSRRYLEVARDIAAKQEKEHRRLGQRLVGDIGFRASVGTAAELFAIIGFARAASERSFTDRADYVAAYGAAVDVARRPDGMSALRAWRIKHKLALSYSYTDLFEVQP